jgi:hypothetical protein
METQFRHSVPGPTPRTAEAARRRHAQAQRCAAGDHVYTWSGQIVDVPGGSPHLVMACAYGAGHKEGSASPRLIGPLLTPENTAKRLWTEADLKQTGAVLPHLLRHVPVRRPNPTTED